MRCPRLPICATLPGEGESLNGSRRRNQYSSRAISTSTAGAAGDGARRAQVLAVGALLRLSDRGRRLFLDATRFTRAWASPATASPRCGRSTSPTLSSGSVSRIPGTLISAILFLFRTRWRTAVFRCAETMTVFAVADRRAFSARSISAGPGFSTGCCPIPTSAFCSPTSARRWYGTSSRSAPT